MCSTFIEYNSFYLNKKFISESNVSYVSAVLKTIELEHKNVYFRSRKRRQQRDMFK